MANMDNKENGIVKWNAGAGAEKNTGLAKSSPSDPIPVIAIRHVDGGALDRLQPPKIYIRIPGRPDIETPPRLNSNTDQVRDIAAPNLRTQQASPRPSIQPGEPISPATVDTPENRNWLREHAKPILIGATVGLWIGTANLSSPTGKLFSSDFWKDVTNMWTDMVTHGNTFHAIAMTAWVVGTAALTTYFMKGSHQHYRVGEQQQQPERPVQFNPGLGSAVGTQALQPISPIYGDSNDNNNSF